MGAYAHGVGYKHLHALHGLSQMIATCNNHAGLYMHTRMHTSAYGTTTTALPNEKIPAAAAWPRGTTDTRPPYHSLPSAPGRGMEREHATSRGRSQPTKRGTMYMPTAQPTLLAPAGGS